MMVRVFEYIYIYILKKGEHKDVVHKGHATVEEGQGNNVTVEHNVVPVYNDVDDLDKIFCNVAGELTSKGLS
jgi:hypothetical protein